MEWILISLITKIIEGAQAIVDAMLDGIVETSFYMENTLISSTTETFAGINLDLSGVFDIFFNFGVSLIVLNFVKKGFEIYVLWSGGDVDADPLQLVIRFIRALAVAVGFPTLYKLLVDAVNTLLDEATAAISGISVGGGLTIAISNIIEDSICMAIAAIILVVCFCILFVQFVVRGAEIMILRIGMPLACVGLLNSDNGVFAPYIKLIFQSALTVLVQILLVKLSITIALLGLGNMIAAIAFAAAAIKTPKILQQFLIASGGGISGVTNTMYSTVRTFKAIKSVVAKK